MAGRGRPPKPPEKLAGHGAAKARAASMRIIPITPVPQPPLPATRPGGLPWPEHTRTWWKQWADEPIAREFSGPDWAFLLDTALLHAALWGDGNAKVAPELRLRLAKYGTTPEDRARLRITYSSADAAEGRRDAASGATARARRAGIKVITPGRPDEEPCSPEA